MAPQITFTINPLQLPAAQSGTNSKTPCSPTSPDAKIRHYAEFTTPYSYRIF
ncbi:MAG: hypothetical protein LBO71_04820 [Prevotellaceae bacterium]|nr:hypothetical protein [Prevotellaceae bacterium]